MRRREEEEGGWAAIIALFICDARTRTHEMSPIRCVCMRVNTRDPDVTVVPCRGLRRPAERNFGNCDFVRSAHDCIVIASLPPPPPCPTFFPTDTQQTAQCTKRRPRAHSDRRRLLKREPGRNPVSDENGVGVYFAAVVSHVRNKATRPVDTRTRRLFPAMHRVTVVWTVAATWGTRGRAGSPPSSRAFCRTGQGARCISHES